MTPLPPDLKRTGLAPPARALAASLAHFAGFALWRARNPASREGYVEAPAPLAATRLHYHTPDGWRASVLHVPACPGGRGEPVVIAHAMGLSPDAYRYGARATLAGRLAAEGFAVYLVTWRGDAEAIAPSHADLSFDAIVEHDLPAALDRVRHHSGFPRVFVIGHGIGGQIALAWAARYGGEALAGMVTLSAPVRFDEPKSEALRAARVARWLPGRWRIPARALGPLVAPLIDRGDRARGALHYAVDDVPAEMIAQVARWHRAGTLVDRTGLYDYTAALGDVRAPLLCAAADGDALCPAANALAAIPMWGGEASAMLLPDGYGHHDVLFARDAGDVVFGPIAAWLSARRDTCWERDGERAAV